MMSDFDAVLERLLGDHAFRQRLATDPDNLLAGYHLSADESELLRAQVTGDTGGHHQVEQRTSKASLFGLLSPLAGMGSSLTDAAAHAGSGGQGLGSAGPVEGLADAGTQGLSSAPYEEFSAADEQAQVGFGEMPAQAGFGEARAQVGLGEAQAQAGFSEGQAGQDRGALLGRNLDPEQVFGRDPSGQGGVGPAPVGDYHTRVDWNGDGRWDEHTYAARADGGVDIVVDANHDGLANFVGVDHDRDGLIDEAYVDGNRDGVLDAHYVDVDGDGWLDEKVPFDRSQGTMYMSRNAMLPDEGLDADD
jgi:hypothetical protein